MHATNPRAIRTYAGTGADCARATSWARDCTILCLRCRRLVHFKIVASFARIRCCARLFPFVCRIWPCRLLHSVCDCGIGITFRRATNSDVRGWLASVNVSLCLYELVFCESEMYIIHARSRYIYIECVCVFVYFIRFKVMRCITRCSCVAIIYSCSGGLTQ